MDSLLSQIYADVLPLVGQGKVADYIPALSKVEANQFGIAICSNDGEIFSIGDADVPFSIQSISKVFNLVLAMEYYGDAIWEKVGREPSGLPFNSMAQLEYEQGIPRNPFINAGALVISDMNQSKFATPNIAVREFVKKLSGNPSIQIDRIVADSEYDHRSRNAAMAYLMKSFNNFDNEVEKVLRNYFCNCALTMSCVDLAKSINFLANKGYSQLMDTQVLTPNETRQVNALMATSGLYDEAGSFAFRVGLPGKSGVGGGIIAIVPGRFSVCVWSPALNSVGNSLAGAAALESMTKHIGWSVY
ncbi:glutaminase [Parashewanella spongiae]|uniref:Glutaminase n=1 Tax=Parashewanella spongiae TaxID=342950 RepID=A0A3A6U9Z0_9GAMM|nr:glutaminase B [Parashewanella spongiae]MCL1078280.1 glutaminase B [Parashewanella spongiae]RJY18774.1 glutaminase [Parashewanella spongiae]